MQEQYIIATGEVPHSLVTPVCKEHQGKFRQLDPNTVRRAWHWKNPLCCDPAHPEEAEPAHRIPGCAVTIRPFLPTHWWQAELLRNCCHSLKKLPQTHWSQKAVNSQRAPGPFEAHFMQTKIRPAMHGDKASDTWFWHPQGIDSKSKFHGLKGNFEPHPFHSPWSGDPYLPPS